MDPALALSAGNDTLGAQNHTVFLFVLKSLKDSKDLLLGVLLGSLLAPACEYLVGVVMVVVVIVATAGAILAVLVVMLVLMLVIVATAGAILAVFVVMLVLMLVIVATAGAILAVFVVMLMMMFVLMIVATAGAILTVFVVMLVVVLVLMLMLMIMVMIVAAAGAILAVLVVMLVMMFVLMLMLMIVIVATAGAMLIMLMVMMVMAVLQKLGKLALKGVLVLHGGNDVSAAEQIPIGGNDRCVIVEIFDNTQSTLKLFLGNVCGVGENYGVCKLDLIVEEFTEILCILFALICVNNGCKAVKYHFLCGNVLYCLDNVGELANARGLDKDTLGSVSLNHLGESFSEIAHKRTADAARVHFGNLNASILHKSAVDTNGAEFVFDQNELFARKSLFDKLFDKRGLTRAQKS